MIKPAGLVMAVLMAGAAAGTYYGLDYVPAEIMPKPMRRADAPEVPPAGGPTQVADVDTARAMTRVEQMEQTGAEDPLTEADLAEAPPETQTSTQVAQAEPSAPEPEPETQPAAAEAPTPAAEEKPEPGWGDEQAAPKPVAPKPAAQPKSAAVAPPRATRSDSADVRASPPPADVIKPWWPDPAKMPANQLKLQYAGQVQGQPAVALLFSAPVNLDTVKLHALIRTASGERAAGQWELGKNPRLAVFKGLKPGRYTVILEPQIADNKGFLLGTKLQGPVYIQGS